MLVSSSSVSGVLFGLSWPILQCLCLSLYVNGFLACDLLQSLTALCCPEDGSRSHGLNLFQGFDGRMEAKLMREKLMLKGRVTFVDEAMRRGINSPGPVYEQKVRLNIMQQDSRRDAHQRVLNILKVRNFARPLQGGIHITSSY